MPTSMTACSASQACWRSSPSQRQACGAAAARRGTAGGGSCWARSWGVLCSSVGLSPFNAAALAVPLACVFGLLCWLTWRDPGAARGVVWAGLVLLATSLLLHKVGLAADASAATDYTWAYQITGMVKHGAELAGWMLVATGIAAAIEVQPGTRSQRWIRSSPIELESVAGSSSAPTRAARSARPPVVALEERRCAER